MRVLPLASLTTSNADRVVITVVLNGALICVQVAPASFDRQIPRVYDDAYTMFGSLGSSSTCRTPRGEQASRLMNWLRLPVHWAGVAAPLCTNVQVAPPSVDL